MQKRYLLTTERDRDHWVAELKDVDSERQWLASGNTEIEAITQVLYKIFETGTTEQ